MAYLKSTGLNKVSYPDGHVLNAKQLYRHSISGTHIQSSGTGFYDTGIDGSFTTAASSNDSYLLLDLWSSMMHHGNDDTVAEIDCTLRTSSSTTHASGDSLQENTSYKWYRDYDSSVHVGQLGRFTYNTSASSEYYPSNMTSYAAGDTLYWRFFFKTNGNTFYIYHGNSMLDVHLWEIAKTSAGVTS